MGYEYCGKKGSRGFHSGKILNRVPWSVNNEDASILLLDRDGSHGLDLSFSTHIFLLDHIKDPALESQIVSRAHRMGATGPVEVCRMVVTADGRDIEADAEDLFKENSFVQD